MEHFTLVQLAGLVGFAGYMIGFASQQFGFINGNGTAYSLINIVSAALVLTSLAEQFNLASALIQVSWITIGLGGICLRAVRKRSPVNQFLHQQETPS